MNQLNQCIVEGTVKEVFDSPFFKIETERNGRKDTFLITGNKKCNLKEGDLVRIVGYLKTEEYYKVDNNKESFEQIVIFAEYIETREV